MPSSNQIALSLTLARNINEKNANGSVTDAAKSLKINRTTLIEKMKKYSIPKVGLD